MWPVFDFLKEIYMYKFTIYIYIYVCTGWNNKIVVLNKTTLQLYFKTCIEKINSGNLIKYESWHRCNIAAFSLNHHLDTAPELEAWLSTSAGRNLAGAWRMTVIRLALVLWEVMLVMFSTYDQMKLSSGFRSAEEGESERRVQSSSTPSEAKPGSLWTFGPAPSTAAKPRVCHPPPNCTRGSPHSSAHPGTLWCWLSSHFRRCEVAWCGPHLKPHQRP